MGGCEWIRVEIPMTAGFDRFVEGFDGSHSGRGCGFGLRVFFMRVGRVVSHWLDK